MVLNRSENELTGLGLFETKSKMYFKEKGSIWGIEDDHKPFENRGIHLALYVLLLSIAQAAGSRY